VPVSGFSVETVETLCLRADLSLRLWIRCVCERIRSFATCVAIAFACNASLPFRCHVCYQGLLPAALVWPLNLPHVFLPQPHICQSFLPPMLPFPVSFFRSCCPADCESHCHCHYLCPRGLPWLLPSNLGA